MMVIRNAVCYIQPHKKYPYNIAVGTVSASDDADDSGYNMTIFENITIVNVDGRPGDLPSTSLALQYSLSQMPGAGCQLLVDFTGQACRFTAGD